jgi:hypothetical protein
MATKKASPAKKVVGKPAVKKDAANNNDDAVGKVLAAYKAELGNKVEHAYYNSNVLPLQQRYDAGERSEGLTSDVSLLPPL